MTNAIDRAGRIAAAAGLLGALILWPVAVVAGGLASPAPMRFAQAALPPSVAAAPAAPGATAPVPTPSKPPGTASQPVPAAPQQARDPQLERRIAELHRRLRITPAQEPQFAAFAEVMRANTQEMAGLLGQEARVPQMNAVESLHFYQQLTETHAGALKRLEGPFLALYSSLADPQKRAADALLGRAAQRAGQRLAPGPERR